MIYVRGPKKQGGSIHQNKQTMAANARSREISQQAHLATVREY